MCIYIWTGKTGGRGALVISLPVNSLGASISTFSRNKSYSGGHQAWSAQLASALSQFERARGKELLSDWSSLGCSS